MTRENSPRKGELESSSNSSSNNNNSKENLNFFKSILFFNNNKSKSNDGDSANPIPFLSPLSNSVVSRCSSF
ncbi:hypothetical protein C3L33_13800, partial [Rhododendron williamsianum]